MNCNHKNWHIEREIIRKEKGIVYHKLVSICDDCNEVIEE